MLCSWTFYQRGVVCVWKLLVMVFGVNGIVIYRVKIVVRDELGE